MRTCTRILTHVKEIIKIIIIIKNIRNKHTENASVLNHHLYANRKNTNVLNLYIYIPTENGKTEFIYLTNSVISLGTLESNPTTFSIYRSSGSATVNWFAHIPHTINLTSFFPEYFRYCLRASPGCTFPHLKWIA